MGENNLKNVKNNSIVFIIIIAVIFGMASGGAGYLIARSYLMDYNIPFFGELNVSGGDYNRANLIIRDARKVVVEQDAKINDTINSARSSIVGIFKKKEAVTSNNFNLNNYYLISEAIGQGLIITSDGWILTNLQLGFPENYVVITNDKKIFLVDEIVSDNLTSYNFIHVTASDLPVKRFINEKEISRGQLIIALNWQGQNWQSRISDIQNDQLLVRTSDDFSYQLGLADEPLDQFRGSFLFNLSSDVLGLIDENKKIIPIYHLDSAIISLLKYGNIRRASLGVNYINLADLVKNQEKETAKNGNDKGVVIYKNNQGIAVFNNSPAGKAGLREGDVITAVDNIEINQENDLADVIQKYLAQDKIKVSFLRNGEKQEVEVILDEIK